jgi:hypothetical protein
MDHWERSWTAFEVESFSHEIRYQLPLRTPCRLMVGLQRRSRMGNAAGGMNSEIDPDSGTLSRSDLRRTLQLTLAGIWLLDAILQFQPFFFTRAFATEMIGPGAQGNPSAVSHSISWVSGVISNHPVATNTPFAFIQLVIAIGIAWRPTVKAALSVSLIWSLAVWWFGEGLGGVLNGDASPLNGAPGPVLLYALLAILLWPVEPERRNVPFVAAGLIGEKAARLVWAALWGGLVFFSLVGSNRSPNGVHDLIKEMQAGASGWLASLDQHMANLAANRGLQISIALAIVFGVIGLRAIAPPALARWAIVLALGVAAAMWLIGQNLGGILSAGATDPDSGPLLILVALAYWPLKPATMLLTGRRTEMVPTVGVASH